MAPASHLQSTDAVHARLRGMSKTQGSDVDGRCDGEEISLRDQREGTSLSDRVKEDVSQEYFTCRIRSGVEGAFGLPQKFPEISKYN